MLHRDGNQLLFYHSICVYHVPMQQNILPSLII
jgi:hypothetical protein